MNVDLQDRLAVVGGAAGTLRKTIEAALAANGARLADATAESASTDELAALAPYLLVNVSQGSTTLLKDGQEADGDELRTFAALVRALAPSVRRVVTVFSGAALVPVRGFAEFSAEQAGLERMTRSLAMELGPDVLVNAVAVGALEGKDAAARFAGHSALRRPGTFDEVCAAVLFLADPDNTYMTGHTLAVDGGFAVGYARNF